MFDQASIQNISNLFSSNGPQNGDWITANLDNEVVSGFLAFIDAGTALVVDDQLKAHTLSLASNLKFEVRQLNEELEFVLSAYRFLFELRRVKSQSQEFDMIFHTFIVEKFRDDPAAGIGHLAAFSEHSISWPSNSKRATYVLSPETRRILAKFKDLMVNNASKVCEDAWEAYAKQNESYMNYFNSDTFQC